ncbi:hypothetical protein N0V93_004381 [Gnomoniopsis smithogilvyi]|uniref:Uncharacterized protein n=1 Tax=Gnomoniopsis smithogilvyi TaxID=1191159 RepID=A0A9W9CW54_9PEZI|nr:hypothetical protein N0V93_004381 [Gnomoniopsis smithogilvyi]
MPDLNSLPSSTRSAPPPPPPIPSSSTSLAPSSPSVAMSLSSLTNDSDAVSSRPNRHRQPSSPSPSLSPSRTAATSLQAAAAVNAGLHHGSRRSSGSLSRQATTSSRDARRQSQVLMNLQLNDPSIPGPGEMRHETHTRRSSNVSSPVALSSSSPFLIASGGDPNHTRSPSLGELHQEMEAEQEASVNRLLVQIREQQVQIRQLQQDQSSAIAVDDSSETAFYQAETSMLVRENQMLRHRVRELERQLEGLTREQPKEEGT